jgi:hypothetical protein
MARSSPLDLANVRYAGFIMRACSRHVARVVLLACATLAVGTSAGVAQSVNTVADDTVTLHAIAVPLGRVLRAIAADRPLAKLTLDPDVEDRPVTVSLERSDLRRALIAVLVSAEVDYVIAGGSGAPLRLVAGDRSFVAAKQRDVLEAPIGRASGHAAAAVDVVTRSDDARTSSDDTTDSYQLLSAAQASELAAQRAAYQSEMAPRIQDMERALALPRLVPAPGSTIDLPFPGPDGSPMTTIVPPPGVRQMSPLPGLIGSATVVPTATVPTRSPSVPDPQLQELMHILVPGTSPR